MPDTSGWLTDDEATALGDLARGLRVVEIGSYLGRSTIALAQTAKHVLAVDHHRGSPEHQPGGQHHDPELVFEGVFTTFPGFVANLRAANVERRVSVLVAQAGMLWSLIQPGWEMVFIDGGHGYQQVIADFQLAQWLLKAKGQIVFHDFGVWPGVTMAVLDIANGRELVRPAGSLAVLRWE
jgi:predicted O-methyltransferase YrrM